MGKSPVLQRRAPDEPEQAFNAQEAVEETGL
jgi:hypothetical protein